MIIVAMKCQVFRKPIAILLKINHQCKPKFYLLNVIITSYSFAINLLTSDGLDYALMMTSEWLSSTDINIKRSSWIANNLSTEEFDSEILDPLLTIDTPFVITVTCDVDKYLVSNYLTIMV